jgi:hypothetical protein
MPFPVPRLDHLVLDVRDRMDEAVSLFSSLGFRLTDRGRHTLGSINHLAVFETDYLELLGFDSEPASVRSDISRFAIGLNGIVFSTDSPDSLFVELQARNVPVQEPNSFSRPVNLPEGLREAKFRVVRLHPDTASFGRVYFCNHLTPQYVWRPGWRQHSNGANSVAQVVISARDPASSSAIFTRIFGPDALRPLTGGTWTLSAGTVQVVFVPTEELSLRFGDAIADTAGRPEFIAALTIRTASLGRTAEALRVGGIKCFKIEPQRVLVPANEAMNVALEFVE